jgi:DNA-binding NtrC family response regulator
MEVVRAGAKGYFHNDGQFRTLKTQLLQGSSAWKSSDKQRSRSHTAFTTCGDLIGLSRNTREVAEMIRMVADLDAPVFIYGETGTGKEVIARAIHHHGSHPDRPFVAIPCGAIPETLIEAELFGHEKGAYTGTVGARKGSLEEASDGTVFFDEIGELSLSGQVKFLRVLQECEFQRLGSNRLIPMKARPIFATHQDLEAKVARGEFRQDLLYRIDVVRITVAPLRERVEDIPLLAEHFLQIYSKKFGLPKPELEPDTIAHFEEYSWPGNVRELEHVIQSSIIMSRGDLLRPHHLPSRLRAVFGEVVEINGRSLEGSFEAQLANFKLRLAQTAVQKNHGNKTLAARSLSISRPYLHRLLRIGEGDQFADDFKPGISAL